MEAELAKASVTILQRGKNSYRLRARWRDPETGRLIEHTQTVRGSREFAEGQMQLLKDSLLNGRIERLSKDTVKGYLLSWIDGRVAFGKIRPTTANTYRAWLSGSGFFERFGDEPIVSVKPSPLGDWVKGTIHSKGKNLTASACIVLKRAFKDAAKEGLIPFNPFERVETPTLTHTPKEHTIGENALKALFAVEDLLVKVAIETGMRRAELAGLRWCDVTEDGVIHVRQTAVYSRRKTYLHPPKTKRGKRSIRVSAALARDLNAARGEPDHYVFSGTENPLPPYLVSARLQRALPEGFSAHDIRHAHATHLLRSKKVSVAAVSKRLGHANVTTTMNIYAHAIEEDEQQIVEAIDTLLRA